MTTKEAVVEIETLSDAEQLKRDQATIIVKNGKIPEDVILHLASGLDLKTTAGIEALKVALDNVMLLDRKQQDYGPGNISGFGLLGIIVRMNDKFERLKTLFGKKRKKALNESMRDTFNDICNYAIIARLVDEGKWPKV